MGLPECCPDCGDQVMLDEVVAQFQEELVPAHSRMRRYDVALGHCKGCKRRVRSRHPEQTSDALGTAGVMRGSRAHPAGDRLLLQEALNFDVWPSRPDPVSGLRVCDLPLSF
ncbi:MAG: hypothetical protein ACRDYA_01995 [Egibacteraceae bacterium]